MTEHTLKITLLTNSQMLHHQSIEGLKNLVRWCLWWKIYGPMGVLNSIDRWLQELQRAWIALSFNINPPRWEVNPIVFALRGADTLSYAIQLKKQGLIKHLFAGPNISVPKHKDDIWFDQHIDTIIVPSQRVFDYHCSLSEDLRARMRIRPAGVADLGKGQKLKKSLILFKKCCPQALFDQISTYLQEQHIDFSVLEYWKFSPAEYHGLIDQYSAMIYLQESETQGLALQEAWMKDLPTLVWDRGYWEYQGRSRKGSQISCPYLTDECGMTFADYGDFREKFPQFWQSALTWNFSPRNYCFQELSDLVCTKKLLNASLWIHF